MQAKHSLEFARAPAVWSMYPKILMSRKPALVPDGAEVPRIESRLAKVSTVETGGVRKIGIKQVIDRMNGHIDLLKMDCEGSEWEILRDAEALGRVDHIRMEYHIGPGQTCDELVRLSEAAGFQIESLRPNRTWGIAWLGR